MNKQAQIEQEKLYNKNQLMRRLRAEFNEPEVVNYCAENALPVDFTTDFLATMALHKRTTISTLVGSLCHHFENLKDQLQVTADMIYAMIDHDFADWDHISKMVVIRLEILDSVQEEIDRYQYPLPMICEPAKVKTNRDTGYYTSRGSIILKNNHHDDDVCLDHINRVNQTVYALNADTVRLIQNEWRHLDKAKEDETFEDFQKRVKAFRKYDRVSREIIESLILAGNRFHLTHRYDKRGRTYAQGYHVNTQGNSWNKAVVEFADKELVS